MITTRFYAPAVRFARFLAIAFACVMLVLSNAFPAAAAGTTVPSEQTKGETQLKKIYEESENSLRDGPPALDEVRDRAQAGVNEVQADADLDKQQNPANSQEAVTFKERVKEALEKVTPGGS